MPVMIGYKKAGIVNGISVRTIMLKWKSEDNIQTVYDYLMNLFNSLCLLENSIYVKVVHLQPLMTFTYSLFKIGPTGPEQLNETYQPISLNYLNFLYASD